MEEEPARSSPSSAGSHSTPARKSRDKQSSETSDAATRHRPRGNLPSAPPFDGDRKKDPKCYKHWIQKVDSYIEIAKKIIDDSEIGLRLHAALEGEAAEYLEDIPARTFGVQDGWKILPHVLKDKYDERRMHKVGSAMRGFFKLSLADKNYALSEVAGLMDKAARQCRETGLVLPDEIMTYFFFEHTGCSLERQANLLLRTGGEYNWKKVKQAVELLYPQTNVPRSRDRDQGKQYGKGRSAHETSQGTWDEPSNNVDNMDLEDWLYYEDPIENLADYDVPDYIPEGLARELHEVFATHRENRAKLAKAVKARGFYVNKGKSKGKGSGYSNKGKGKASEKGGPSKGKGKGKARNGMSLEELKKVTTRADCHQPGHWKGDPQCRGPKRAHETVAAEDDNQDPHSQAEGEEYWQGWDPGGRRQRDHRMGDTEL